MKIEITDEMVRKTEAALDETFCLKATLEAVAPLIADQVLERAAKALVDARDYRAAEETRALKEPTP